MLAGVIEGKKAHANISDIQVPVAPSDSCELTRNIQVKPHCCWSADSSSACCHDIEYPEVCGLVFRLQ